MFTRDVSRIAFIWSFNNENKILDLIFGEQISPDLYSKHFNFYRDFKKAYSLFEIILSLTMIRKRN